MQPFQNDITPQSARRALEWLVEMGVDEIIGELPVDRFAKPAAAPALVAAPSPTATGETRRPAALAGLATLDAVADDLRALADFPLQKTASHLCFTDGNPDAAVMVIGDVPGRDEDLSGKPFAGQNGVLLGKMLAAIGLDPQSLERNSGVSLFNFVPWRPPGNRAPTAQEIAICEPYVRRAIAICQPSFILALGTIPLQRLSGRSEGLMALRGRWLEVAVGERTIPLIGTFPPRHLLLQTAQKRLAWRDLLALREKLDAHS
jgi:DNA polymerase